MLPTQRRQAILAEVRQHSAVAADDLAREFDVSVETIRRDLRDLQRKGLLDRVYGGATRPAGRSSEGSFAARSTRHIQAKRAIAGLAASLVEPGETIVIDVGTTALEVARALPASFRGRVLTNSVPAGAGTVRPGARRGHAVRRPGPRRRRGLLGRHAEAFFDEFYADRAFLGSGGVHPEAGADRLLPRRGGGAAHDHRAHRGLLRAGRFEQARRHRRAPGLPARPRHRGPDRRRGDRHPGAPCRGLGLGPGRAPTPRLRQRSDRTRPRDP